MAREVIKFEDDDGNELSLPGKYEVCDRCDGRGSMVNPAIDGNGLSAEDFAQDPDFKEDYLNGLYDIPCRECDGLRVVLVPDEARADPKLLEQYRERVAADRRADAEERRAMMLESGMFE